MTRVFVAAVVLTLSTGVSSFLEARQAATAQAVQAVPAAALVNLNTATAADLEKLPGIGPSIAARILEYRQKNGAFKKVEELMNVRGIGEKVFLKIKPLVTVTPPKFSGSRWVPNR